MSRLNKGRLLIFVYRKTNDYAKLKPVTMKEWEINVAPHMIIPSVIKTCHGHECGNAYLCGIIIRNLTFVR